jgi:hypothetical protein
MKVPSEQIASKKRIGSLKGKPVWHYRLVGGLHLVAGINGEPLGMGPHRLVARRLAEQSNPDLTWDELSKADHLEPEVYEHLLGSYEEITSRAHELWLASQEK